MIDISFTLLISLLLHRIGAKFTNSFYMANVKPKKHLGQHFLTSPQIAQRIIDGLKDSSTPLLEIGPGTGVLTNSLIELPHFFAIDIDEESIDYLKTNWPQYADKIIFADFLKADLNFLPNGNFSIIGNFPYNISSQIFFRVLDYRHRVQEVVCMIQKEVAERIACSPGSKTYGILSVLLQAYYSIEYLFTVHEGSFNPPPKVKSGVIRLIRNNTKQLDCDEAMFFKVVKTGFNQRRKTLRNSLKSLGLESLQQVNEELLSKRPEQLGVNEFVAITRQLSI